jgi:hypothetical protein
VAQGKKQMADFEFSQHAKEMLQERNIAEEWVWRVIATGKRQAGADGNVHYTKRLRERDGRVLHVVINPNVKPSRIVTLFFDRRLR